MIKLILVLLIVLVGCESRHPNHVESKQDNSIANNIVGRYEGDISKEDVGNETIVVSRGYVYSTPREMFKTLNWDYFVEGNECIYSDYIIAYVTHINEDKGTFGIEVGSNCYDHSEQGPSVTLKIQDIPVKDDVKLQVYDVIKIYYKFPEDVEPKDYIDYVNYATSIEKIN